jgi:NADH-quinone oxidoreductase subunit H
MIALATVLMLWAVIPLSSSVLGADINVGVLYIVAIGAIGTLGIIMAGWASNNKFALLGALRAVALAVAYEVPMVIALMIPVIFARSMSLQAVVQGQVVWYVVAAPIAAVILLISALAELGRSPFDLAEAESEIVAGYNVEYSGMKFGLFYAGELLHALTMGALVSTFFLGGWRGPFAETYPILGVFYLFVKAFFIYWVIMWVRYSVPRIRIDHMLNFNWKFLTPLALVVLMATALLDRVLGGFAIQPGSVMYNLAMFLMNVVVIAIALNMTRGYARSERTRVAEPKPFARPGL